MLQIVKCQRSSHNPTFVDKIQLLWISLLYKYPFMPECVFCPRDYASAICPWLSDISYISHVAVYIISKARDSYIHMEIARGRVTGCRCCVIC